MQRTPLYETIMQSFINDGSLERAIEQRNKLKRDHIIFVSYSPDGGILRLIILGDCGMCSARHIRNICNMTYTADCLFPILTLVFPVIKRIDIVRSDDEDFEVLVGEMGGRITTPFSEDDVFSFGDLNRFCLDNHPEIDGNIKCLSPLYNNQRHDMGDTTRRIFTDRNNLCWSVMADSSVVDRDR